MNTAILAAILAIVLYIAYRVTPKRSHIAESGAAVPSNVVMFPTGDPGGLVEILNADGHCIGRRPHGHPDLEWARTNSAVTLRGDQ